MNLVVDQVEQSGPDLRTRRDRTGHQPALPFPVKMQHHRLLGQPWPCQRRLNLNNHLKGHLHVWVDHTPGDFTRPKGLNSVSALLEAASLGRVS